MTIDCAFFGRLAADAELRTSQASKQWARLRVCVGKDDAVQWVSLAVFGKGAEAAGVLKKGDRIYAEGTIKIESWTGKDGVERHGLSVAAWKCDRTHLIGQNKPKRDDGPPRTAARSTSDPFNDAIPF